MNSVKKDIGKLDGKIATLAVGTGLAATMMASPAFAGGSGMPWEGPLQQIVDSFTGPVAQ